MRICKVDVTFMFVFKIGKKERLNRARINGRYDNWVGSPDLIVIGATLIGENVSEQ